MDLRKITYECKKCGWQTSVPREWADLRPKRCMGKKCNESFRLHPENLIVHHPAKEAELEAAKLAKEEKQSNNHKKSNKKYKYESRQRQQSASASDERSEPESGTDSSAELSSGEGNS